MPRPDIDALACLVLAVKSAFTYTTEAGAVAENDRLERIEDKIDKLSEAVVSIARIEERTLALFKRMDQYDQRQTKLVEDMGEVRERMYDLERTRWAVAVFERGLWISFAAVVSAAVAYFAK